MHQVTLQQLYEGPADHRAWAGISVPVKLHELAGAEVLWINRRWLLSQGIDTSEPERVKEIEDWLLNRFAYIVWEDGHSPAHFTGKTRKALVDRYGGRGIGNSGGSGRCAYMDGFYVKGVGPTPLRDSSGPFFHIHGALTLEEAIREAVLAEVACAEFPNGAIPSIAILAMQPRLFQGDADPRGEPRALMIRPAFKRVGHLEPATQFIAKLRPDEASADANRVVFALRAWIGNGTSTPLIDLAERLGTQLAFGRVQRMSHGSFVSSNVSQAGELADFGSFRAVPTWEAAHTVRGMPPFGQELPVVSRTIIWDLAFQVQRLKHLLPSRVNAIEAASAVSALQGAFNETLKTETRRLFGLVPHDPVAEDVVALCTRYFSTQNRVVRNYYDAAEREAPSEWLLEQLTTGTLEAEATSTELGRIALAISEALDRSSAPAHARLTAKRMLMPRTGIYREKLQAWVYTLVFNTSTWLRENLRAAIAQRIAESRRVWKEAAAPGLGVLGQALDDNGNSLLWLSDAHRSSFMRLTVTFAAGRGCLFDQQLAACIFLNDANAIQNGAVTIDVPTPEGYNGTTHLTVAGKGVVLPPMTLTYVGAKCAEVV
jgi:hypothetical protein